jgi:hypothetical protein
VSNRRTRLMTPDQLERHKAGLRRLDHAFGATAGPGRRVQTTERKLSILEALGFGARPKR